MKQDGRRDSEPCGGAKTIRKKNQGKYSMLLKLIVMKIKDVT